MNGMNVEFGRDATNNVTQIEFYGEMGLRLDDAAAD
jgi:hypothetical protein